jgi:hypothetical protein
MIQRPFRYLLLVTLALSCSPARAPADAPGHTPGSARGRGATAGSRGSAGRGCDAEPLGDVRAFLETGASSTTLEATLVSLSPPNDGGFIKLALHETEGAVHTLTLRSPTGRPPLHEGEGYRFRVDYLPGYPPASGVLIWKGATLLYAAASDPSHGHHGLADGVPGFALTLLPSECASRLQTECYESVRDARLRVAHAGTSATLYQGESANLGEYRVTCLTAEEVTYRSRCADAGRVVLSYVIERRD